MTVSHVPASSGVGSDGVGSGDVGSERVAGFLRKHPWLVTLGRAGWIAKGIVYSLVGILAASIALEGQRGSPVGEREASQQGAVSRIAEASLGTLALAVVASGLVLYACWRLVTVLLPADTSAHAWATRIGYGVSTVVYLFLAWSALSYVTSPGRSGSQERSEDAQVARFTREMMSHEGGRWVVALIGLLVIGVGVYFLVKGLRARFDDQLTGGDVGPIRHGHLVVLGRIGWVGRGVMMMLIGWFLVQAVRDHNPDEAQGLDGALRRTVESSTGAVLVLVVAAGLACYGVYCVVSAPRRRLAPADE